MYLIFQTINTMGNVCHTHSHQLATLLNTKRIHITHVHTGQLYTHTHAHAHIHAYAQQSTVYIVTYNSHMCSVILHTQTYSSFTQETQNTSIWCLYMMSIICSLSESGYYPINISLIYMNILKHKREKKINIGLADNFDDYYDYWYMCITPRCRQD